MENFYFALNATAPVILVIALGFLLQKIRLLNDSFSKAANDYVFKCALPASLFSSISRMDLYTDFHLSFCLFCVLVTTITFAAIWGLSWIFIKDKLQVGAFAQAAARSSAAILGTALAVNIYGNSGMVPMMVLSSVPFFNVYSVIILSFSPQNRGCGSPMSQTDRWTHVKEACRGVITNPMILGILAGLPFSLFRIPVPGILDSTLNYVGGTAVPIAMLVVGASFSGKEAMERIRLSVAATFIKLLLLPAVFLPAAVFMGFRETELMAILIMLGSPSTIGCYVMAKNMYADSVLTSNTIMLSTLFSSITITFWLYVLKSLMLI